MSDELDKPPSHPPPPTPPAGGGKHGGGGHGGAASPLAYVAPRVVSCVFMRGIVYIVTSSAFFVC